MTVSSGLLKFKGVFTYREIMTSVRRNGRGLHADRQAQDGENEQAFEGWHDVRVRCLLLALGLLA